MIDLDQENLQKNYQNYPAELKPNHSCLLRLREVQLQQHHKIILHHFPVA
jgi:hypothetical protein